MNKIYVVVSVHAGVIFNVGAFGKKEDAVKWCDELKETASDDDSVDWFPCEVEYDNTRYV